MLALLISLPSLSGCISTVAAVAQAGAQLGSLYLTAKKEPIRIITAECGNIEPIYPGDDWQSRLTAEEQRQIYAQSVRLRELCPEDE